MFLIFWALDVKMLVEEGSGMAQSGSENRLL
jgi:hypothetical protein